MSDERIDSYVDRAAVAEDTKFFTDSLNSILELFDKVKGIKLNIGGANSMAGIADGAREAESAIKALTASKDKLLKSDMLAAKAAKESANQRTAEAKAAQASAKSSMDTEKAKALEAKAAKELAAAEKLLAQARKENAAAAIKEQQLAGGNERQKERDQVNEIGRAYVEYSKAAREAALRAKSYALTLGENDPRTLAAIKNAKEMNETLARVDTSVGQYGRNVGNYKSGWDGLGNSFTQISRELPSLTISVSQFALAISNNLPMLADEIGKVKNEMKELKAQGQEVPSMFKRIASSALSFNVFLSVGIALITAYAGKIAEVVTQLFDHEAAAKKAAKEQQELNERIQEGIELTQKYEETTNRSSGTINRGLENQLLYARAAGKSEGEILEIEKKILFQRQLLAQQKFFDSGGEKKLGKLATDLDSARIAYDELNNKLNTKVSVSGFLVTQDSDEQKKKDIERLADLKRNFDFQAKLFDDQKQVVEEYYNANRDAELKDIELKKFAAEQRAKFFADELQYRADNLKAFSQIEDAEELTRLNARKEALKNEQAISDGQYSDDLRAAKGNLVKIYEANRQHKFDKKKLQEDYEKDVQNIHQTSLARLRDMDKRDNDLFAEDKQDRINKEIDAAQNEVDRRQRNRAIGQQAEVEGLNKSYEAAVAATRAGSRQREKVEREFAERRADIEYSYGLAELKNQIYFAEQYIKIHKAAGEDVTAEETKLAELRMQLSDMETKHVLENGARKDKDAKERLDGIRRGVETFRSVYAETTSFISGLLDASIDKEKNRIEGQIEDIEKRKTIEIDAINASSQSTQDKAAAVALVEAKAALQKEQLQRKQAQLDQQKAKFDKAIAIGQIIANTALAVVKALPNVAAALAVGAIGAGQLAVALATPIPKFKTGRDSGPETFAIVGDGGRREVVTSPDLSQAYITPATDTFTHLKKDWKVFPDVNAFQTAAASMGSVPQLAMLPVAGNDNSEMISAMRREMGAIREAINAKQENHFYLKNGEWNKAVKAAQDWIIYKQNNL